MRLAQALFAPRAVALVGASGDPGKNTARPQRYLRKHGYAGRIVPINATRDEVLGERAYRRLADAPGEIDHAFIMVEGVEAALEDCARKGVAVASIYTNGFADAGAAGAEREKRLLERARALGVRLLGPNSMGVIDLRGRLALTVNAVLEADALPAGSTSLVSQSGTMLGTLLSRGAARGLGYAKLISVGNEADLGVGELVELLVGDADTKVIALFLETVRDAERLASAARRAHAAGKPIVAYKLGRSALGVELARSHTGALAGSDAALDAFFRDCGIVRVDMLESLIEIPPLLARRKPMVLRRTPKVAVVTTTGGGAATVVDRLGLRGIELAGMHDLTMAGNAQGYRATLEKLLASADCDAVLAAVGSSAQFHPEFAIEPIVTAQRTEKPLVTFLTPHAERSLALLAANGVPAFRTPEACADSLAAFFAWRTPREFGDGWGQTLRSVPDSGSVPELIRAPSPNWFAVLTALGIPVVEQAIAQAPGYAHGLRYPVALKRIGVEHKTEQGAVALDIRDDAELARHARRMGDERLLVQRMEHGLAEAIVGYRDDPVVGPLALVGAGGTLAEIYKDFAVEMAPVSEAEALAMIERVKGLAVVRGYRNLPRGDVVALARAVAALSRLALVPGRPVREAEANPVIVKREGVVAVDALIALKE
ncbi:MAG TPA: acetate--CoA ligase family protein [Burkholderiales bacterium]|nr:acetate--CoA ligase family protein [Burkholderiales bacterium]